MASKLINNIIILSSLSISCLSAQDVNIETVDASSLKIDSSYILDNAFSSAMVIQSYEELLETYYNAVLEVDKRLNFNPYRLQPGNTEPVNPFVYQNIILSTKGIPHLEGYKNGFQEKDKFGNTAEDVLWESRMYISETNPPLINTTWNLLPDPPETERKAITIRKVELDLSQIDKRRKKIDRPVKIEKQHYTYRPWETRVISTISASQTSYSNWAKGGSNAFSLSGHLVSDADYMSYDKKTRWQNNIETRLGYVQEEDKPFVKNLDLFRINSQFARNAVNKWFYAINAEFTSQFFDSYDYKADNYEDPISGFMAPAYFKVSIGLDYKYGTKTNKKLFSVQASPLSYKLTYVNDTTEINQTKYGIEADKRARQEVGGSLIFNTEYSYNGKVTARSKLLFFSNYLENPENIDINWNSTLTYNISRIFSITFTLDMIYDDDISILLEETEDGTKIYGQRLQVKEYLGFGFTYRFM